MTAVVRMVEHDPIPKTIPLAVSLPHVHPGFDRSAMPAGRRLAPGLRYIVYATVLACSLSTDPSPYSASAFVAPTRYVRTASNNKTYHSSGSKKTIPRAAGTLASTSTAAINDTEENNYGLIDDYHPQTMSIGGSMVFYARYVYRTIQQRRIRAHLTPKSKQRLLPKLKRALRRRGWTDDAEARRREDEATLTRLQAELGIKDDKMDAEDPKMSLRETLAMLNKSRENLINLVGYDSALLVPSFGFLILGALMTSIIPYYYSQCVTCLAAAETTSRAKVVNSLFGLAVASVLAAFFTGLRGGLFWIAGARGNYNVRVKLHRNLLLQEAAFFDSNETGVLLSRLNNDVNKIGMVISFHVNIVLRQFAQFVFGSVYLVKISGRLSLSAFAGISLVAFTSALYGRFSRGLSARVQDTFADASAVAETSFSMSETVRAFDGLHSETGKYEAAQKKALELEEVQAWAYGSHKFVSESIQAGLQCSLLFACWNVGRAGGLPVAQLTSFMFYVNFVLESSTEVGDQWAKIQSAIGASSNVFDLIRRIPAIRDNPTNKIDSKEDDGNGVSNGDSSGKEDPVVSMKGMSVTYEQMSVPALKDIDLDIHPRDRVAIVGRSGSGKSSMLRTILRFYDPSSGSISMEGKDLRNIARTDIASKVSVVQQEPHLFPMTLMDNVLYGIDMDSFDRETGEPCYGMEWRDGVSEALRLAGLPVTGELKNDLGLDLDTRVGEGGRTLSGGQKQRVAIARALIRSPEILLLDEPTAAIDSKSEKVVVAALGNVLKETKSMLMVTHRLGVVRSLEVNKVVVLEKGEIAETGHPEDLLRSEGIYAQLAEEQGIFALTSHGARHATSSNQ